MAGLMIKDVPPELHQRLRSRAAANERSLAREVLVILRSVLEAPAGPPTLEELQRNLIRGTRPLTQAMLDEAKRERP